MMTPRVTLLALVLAFTASCGSDECAGLALDDFCLEDPVASRRVSGTWTDDADLEVENTSGGVVVTLAGAGAPEALALTLSGVPVDTLFQQGYQSWGFSGTVSLPPAVELDPDGYPLMQAARSGDPLDEELGVSYHAAVFRRGSDGPALLVGSTSARIAVTGVAATREADGNATIRIVYGPAREALPTGRAEPLLIVSADSAEAAFELLSARVADAHPDAAPARPPGGWFSWNENFADIDADLIAAHVNEVDATLSPVGLPLVEIDDGWQRSWGDWQANERFPDGMAPIAADIAQRGLVAGIWLAPFLVELDSSVASADPALFVRDDEDQPIRHRISGNPRTFFVLDGTNEDAMRIVTDRIEELSAAGYSFFKLDFLYAGALPGTRAQAVTGTEALRAGMQRIRAAAGDGAVINACGSPTLPILELADSLRIGPDTAFEGFDLSWSTVAGAARNVAARAYLFPSLWPDADQVQVRAPFTEAEARAGAAVAALAGPAYSIGDDLTRLPDGRLDLALDAALLDIAAGAEPARPVDLMGEPSNEIAGNPVIEALRNASGFVTAPPPRFRAVGESGIEYTIEFDWFGRAVSIEPTP